MFNSVKALRKFVKTLSALERVKLQLKTKCSLMTCKDTGEKPLELENLVLIMRNAHEHREETFQQACVICYFTINTLTSWV